MKHLLMDAKHEIESLRRRNELLNAKVEVFEVFAAALLGPRPQMGMAIDVAWSLQKEIDKLNGVEQMAPQRDPEPTLKAA